VIKIFKHICIGATIGGVASFLMMVLGFFAYKIKSPIAGIIDGWVWIFIEILTVVFISKYYFTKEPILQMSKKRVFFVGSFITLWFSITWSAISFIFIKFIYPNYETEMIRYLYHPSPFASAAETKGMYLVAQLGANAYSGSIIHFISGVIIGLIASSIIGLNFNRLNIYRNLTSRST